MKKLLVFTVIIMSLAISSCSSESNDNEVKVSPDGKDSVVYVHYRDDNGNMNNFYMNYLLFHTLMNSGGYNNVYHHYHSNPTIYRAPIYRRYETYKYRPTPSYSKPRSNLWSNSSKSVSTPKSISSPNRSTYKPSYTPSKSYSPSYSRPSYSPSRSSSRSFSSPGRH